MKLVNLDQAVIVAYTHQWCYKIAGIWFCLSVVRWNSGQWVLGLTPSCLAFWQQPSAGHSSDVVLETRVLVSIASRTKIKVLVLDHEVLVLNIWSWSWSRSWRKSLAVFQDFCCNSWRQWARHTTAFCERQQKQFAIWKPLFDRTICAPCTSASVERVFNNGAIC